MSFAEVKDGTRMDVVQTYSVIDPDAAWMVSGAPQGGRPSTSSRPKSRACTGEGASPKG